MARFIDLEDDRVVFCGCDGDYEKYNIPEDMPTADVVEAVRCKDCRFHENEQPGMVYCPEIVGGWAEDDGFCYMGKRRTDDEEIH